MDEGLNNAEFEKTVSHTEFPEVGEAPKGILPKASFEYSEGLPTALTYESRRYDVQTSVERQSAANFFEHTVTRDDGGDIKSLNFTKPEAKVYFDQLFRSVRSQHARAIKQGLQTELELEHFGKVGSYNNLPQEVLDKLYSYRISNELSLGREHSDIEEKDVFADDAVALALEKLTDTKEKYFPSEHTADPHKVSVRSNRWFLDDMATVLDLVERVQASKTVVATHFTEIGLDIPLKITRITIAEPTATTQGEYFVEERVAEKAAWGEAVFGFLPRPSITIFDNAFFESDTLGHVFSPSREFQGTHGRVTRDGMFLEYAPLETVDDVYYSGEDLVLATHYGIKGSIAKRVAEHEATHVIDPFLKEATRPQKEGFARAVENGFSFGRSKFRLRQAAEYSQDTTLGKLLSVLGKNPPDTLSPTEVYDLPATFFSWTYKKLGQEKFIQFYGLLTGGAFMAEHSQGLDRVIDEIRNLPKKSTFRGEVLPCLGQVLRDEYGPLETPKEFIERYLKEINKS